ncbi:MAG: hypothetical protein ABJN98_13495 [Roseibium sp.]
MSVVETDGIGSFRRTATIVSTFILTAVIAAVFWSPATAKEFSNNFSSLGVMTCQQLWYIEQEVLAEGRICPKSERARRTFSSKKKCISEDERILPDKVLEYLDAVRDVGKSKSCSGF